MIKLLKRSICDPAVSRKLWFFTGALFFVFGLNAYAAGAGSVCFKETCFHPEIARTQAEKQHGLMGRTALAADEGMLFVYEKEVVPVFWMKNMRIPLDFVWLDRQGKTVDLHEAVSACGPGDCPTIASRSPVQYVLEVSAGAIQKSGIKIGDPAAIKLGATN